MSHRKLDKDILCMDDTRGWQSMGILHYLGLVDDHKGLFKNTSLNAAIALLSESDDEGWLTLCGYLKEAQSSETKYIDSAVFERD